MVLILFVVFSCFNGREQSHVVGFPVISSYTSRRLTAKKRERLSRADKRSAAVRGAGSLHKRRENVALVFMGRIQAFTQC